MTQRIKRYKPSIVQSAEHIPQDYVAIGQFHKTDPGLHRQLNRLCEREEVLAFRLGNAGPWFVHSDHIDATMRRRAARRSGEETKTRRRVGSFGPAIADGRLEAAVTALCEINNGITLLVDVVQRLAAAVDRAASQQKQEPEYASHYAPMTNGTHQ